MLNQNRLTSVVVSTINLLRRQSVQSVHAPCLSLSLSMSL